MATTLTKSKLRDILTSGLSLANPRFILEKVGGRLVGNIISPSFKGKSDHERQKLIWDELDRQLGAESTVLVGMLLAYTPEEWNMGKDDKTAAGEKKVG